MISNSPEIAKAQLADAQNQLLPIGSTDVVTKLMIFHDYIKPSNSQNFLPEEHNRSLTNLLKSMRADLYKNRRINKNYPTIHLTGNSSEK